MLVIPKTKSELQTHVLGLPERQKDSGLRPYEQLIKLPKEIKVPFSAELKIYKKMTLT